MSQGALKSVADSFKVRSPLTLDKEQVARAKEVQTILWVPHLQQCQISSHLLLKAELVEPASLHYWLFFFIVLEYNFFSGSQQLWRIDE